MVYFRSFIKNSIFINGFLQFLKGKIYIFKFNKVWNLKMIKHISIFFMQIRKKYDSNSQNCLWFDNLSFSVCWNLWRQVFFNAISNNLIYLRTQFHYRLVTFCMFFFYISGYFLCKHWWHCPKNLCFRPQRRKCVDFYCECG